jgi:hypothetical protein
MERTESRRHGPFQMLSVLAGVLVMSSTTAAAAGLRLIPDSIRIGPFFSGAHVHVSGEIQAGSQAIVEIIGKRIEEQLLRKGRRWDIWMSVGEIDIEDAPYVYFALSTDPTEFSGLGADAEYGYARLKKRISFKGDVQRMQRAEIFRWFIRLKEEENLYSQQPGALKLSSPSGGIAKVEGSFRIPSRIPPGDYLARLSVMDHGRLLQYETAHLRVQMSGLPAFLSSLSRGHGALYGLFAVAIAVVFGFLVGVAFKRGRAH